jgi:hypothetical protein
MSTEELDTILTSMVRNVRNDTLEIAAKVASLYGAPAEACQRILMLKADEKKEVA